MPAMKRKIKDQALLLIIAVGVSLLVFSGYRLLYVAGVTEYAKEFIAGCMGAVITIFATAVLLKSQSDNEIRKDQISGIFREKLKVYSGFIQFLSEMHEDNEITDTEINKLIDWGCKLSLICQPVIVYEIYQYIVQLLVFGTDKYVDLTPEDRLKWKAWQIEEWRDRDPKIKSNLDDEMFCVDQFTSVSTMIGTLRLDIMEREVSGFEESIHLEIELEKLWSLHSVVGVDIQGDGVIQIAVGYPEGGEGDEDEEPRLRRPSDSSDRKRRRF